MYVCMYVCMYIYIDKQMWDSHPVIHIRSIKMHDNSPDCWKMICWGVRLCQNFVGANLQQRWRMSISPSLLRDQWNSKISGLVRWCQVTKDLQLKILVVFRQGDKKSPLKSWTKGFASLYVKHLSKIKPSITLRQTNIAMEDALIEDVFPIENRDFPLPC